MKEKTNYIRSVLAKRKVQTFYRTMVDEQWVVTRNKFKVHLKEVLVNKVVGEASDKGKKYFHGIYSLIQTPYVFSGVTCITRKDDSLGLKDRKTWKHLVFRNSNNVETILESNDFHKIMTVITSDEQEARVILTPDFMYVLQQWYAHSEKKVRISFVDASMNIMFPDNDLDTHHAASHKNLAQQKKQIKATYVSLFYIKHLVGALPRQLTIQNSERL